MCDDQAGAGSGLTAEELDRFDKELDYALSCGASEWLPKAGRRLIAAARRSPADGAGEAGLDARALNAVADLLEGKASLNATRERVTEIADGLRALARARRARERGGGKGFVKLAENVDLTPWGGAMTVTWLTGYIDMPRPTGRWLQTADGGWYEEHTDWIERNDDGSERKRKPYKPHLLMYSDVSPATLLTEAPNAR